MNDKEKETIRKLGDLRKAYKKGNLKPSDEFLENIRKFLEDYPEEGGLSSFLASIGSSVIDSQRNLDKQSEAYIESTSGRDYLPPTLFRIPKITADIKLGLSKRTSSELNAFVFSKKVDSEEINQQSIKMEITAVPAPVDAVQYFKSQMPTVNIVFDKLERQKLFGLLEGSDLEIIPGTSGDKTNPLNKFKAAQDKVVICKTYRDEEYLIFFDEPNLPNVKIWTLKVGASKKTLKREDNLGKSEMFIEFIRRITIRQK